MSSDDTSLSGVYRDSGLPVLVQRDGAWYHGEIQGWRHDNDEWLAAVDYLGARDIHYLELVEPQRIRKVKH